MRKLAIFSGAFALAAALCVYVLHDVQGLWVAGVCLVLSLLMRALGLRRCAIAALGLTVGVLYCFAYSKILLRGLEQADQTEQLVSVRLSEELIAGTYGDKTTGTVKLGGRSYEAMIYSDGELLAQAVKPGDWISCIAHIKIVTPDRGEGSDLYRASRGIFLCLYPTSQVAVERGQGTIPERAAQWLRGKIDTLYEGSVAGLVRALLTGRRDGLNDQVQNQLSVAGMSHAVAVSGMHVSMLLTLVSMLCGGNPRLRAMIGIPVVLLFAVMTGGSASVWRAAVMQIMLLCAPLLGRQSDAITTLAAASMVLLLENPWAIASVSFQLSFAAVTGLFLLAGPVKNRMLRWKKHPGTVLRFVASGVSATLGASIFTMPLTVYYFGIISIVAPLTNLLGLWAVTGVFTLGLLSCCLGPVGPYLAWVVTKLGQFVLGLCKWTAAFPYAAAYPQNTALMLWAVLAYVAAMVLLFWKRSHVAAPVLSALTVAFLACILWGRWDFTRYDWRFTALDVGQGQCLMVQLGDFTAVIDCGGSDPVQAGEDLARTLHSAGMTKVDALIITHYDDDHFGGVEQLLSRVRVDQIYLPPGEHGLSGNVYEVETKTVLSCQGGKLTIYPPVSGENDNNSSLCVLATAAEYDMLITGDLDQYAEMRLMSRWDLPEVELLVAGHHGSKNSTSQVLLEKLQPETVVISVGKDNSYGHPSPETLARIETIGAQVLRTDELGTIILTP